jgi:uncharacterized protein
MKINTISKTIGHNVDGSTIEIKGYSLKGKQSIGKSLYIQGGIHGGEVTIWIVEKLFNYLRKKEIVGEITLIPVANPVAWNNKSYFYSSGKHDTYLGKDWNRNFPGNKYGTLGERISNALLEIAKKSDFVIDLHTSRKSKPFSIVLNKHDLQYAAIAGLEYTYLLDTSETKTSNYTSTLSGQLATNQIPNIAIECGSHDSYEKEYVDMVFTGIVKLITHFGLIKEEVAKDEVVTKYYTKYVKYRAKNGGFVKFIKNVGERYKKGDTLYELLNPVCLHKLVKVRANEDGIVQKVSPTHIYRPGDEVMENIPLDNIRLI